jgi:hypothetical protein
MAVLHRFETLPEGLTVGAKLTLSYDKDGKSSFVPEREKDNAVYRGR